MPLTRSQKRSLDDCSREDDEVVPDSAMHGEMQSLRTNDDTDDDDGSQNNARPSAPRSICTASAKRKAVKECSSNPKKTRTLGGSKTPKDEGRPMRNAPTVTPGSSASPKRRIRFPSPDPALPKGVVNIFSNSFLQELGIGDHVPFSFEEKMRSNYCDHISAYGSQMASMSKEQEQREVLPFVTVPDENEMLPNQPLLTVKMRRTLVSWLGEVAQEYRLSESTYHLSITILDAILALGPTKQEFVRDSHLYNENDDVYVSDDESNSDLHILIRKTDFQAYGCACLWIASKIEDQTPPAVEQFCYISDFSFRTPKLVELESTVCKMLHFRLARTTPVHFFGVFERASHVSTTPSMPLHQHNDRLEWSVLYLLQLARYSYALSFARPSLVCAAALYLARATLRLQQDGRVWSPTLEYYTGYSAQELQETVYILYKLQLSTDETESVYKRFESELRGRASRLVPLRLEDLNQNFDFGEDEADYCYDVLVEDML